MGGMGCGPCEQQQYLQGATVAWLVLRVDVLRFGGAYAPMGTQVGQAGGEFLLPGGWAWRCIVDWVNRRGHVKLILVPHNSPI